MKSLEIEWKHLDKEGATCVRCTDTGRTLVEVVRELAQEYEGSGIQVEFKETLLGAGEIRQSNQILFNGIPLESLVPGASVGESSCASCCDMIGEDVACRTVEHGGTVYEAIPEHLIRVAAGRAASCCC